MIKFPLLIGEMPCMVSRARAAENHFQWGWWVTILALFSLFLYISLVALSLSLYCTRVVSIDFTFVRSIRIFIYRSCFEYIRLSLSLRIFTLKPKFNFVYRTRGDEWLSVILYRYPEREQHQILHHRIFIQSYSWPRKKIYPRLCYLYGE